MENRTLGSSQVSVPTVGAGTWATGGGKTWGETAEHQCIEAIQVGLDAGVTLVDTAPCYGNGKSEIIVGKAIAARRKDVVLSTKFGLLIREHCKRNATPQSMRQELDESLERLKTDYLDVYFLHYPDPDTPIEKTMEGLLQLKEEGTVKAIGLSNHSPELIGRALDVGPVDCVQDQCSLLKQNTANALLPLCREHGIGFMAYAPLGGGILTGKYSEKPTFAQGDARKFFYPFYEEPHWSRTQELLATMRDIARRRDTTPGGVAIAWVAAQAGVSTVLVGAKNQQQARTNAAASEVVLEPQEIEALTTAGLNATRS